MYNLKNIQKNRKRTKKELRFSAKRSVGARTPKTLITNLSNQALFLFSLLYKNYVYFTDLTVRRLAQKTFMSLKYYILATNDLISDIFLLHLIKQFLQLMLFDVSKHPNLSSSINLIIAKDSVGQMKKQPKFDVSLQPRRFTIYPLMVFQFDKFLTDNLRTSRLVY